RPAAALQRQRAGHLEVPRGHRTLRISAVDVEMNMRVGPLDFGHDAFNRHWLVGVVIERPAMVSGEWRDAQQGARQNRKRRSHHEPPQTKIDRAGAPGVVARPSYGTQWGVSTSGCVFP